MTLLKRQSLFASLLIVAMASAAQATVCIVPTSDLPPNCTSGYLSPQDVHMIIDGLPPGTTIQLGAEHRDFFNTAKTPAPSGSLGGETETFDSFLLMHLNGTGLLAGYNRNLNIPMHSTTHIAPRNPLAPVQSFDTVMFMQQGQITGDPDFDLLRITAGNGFGLPSPGHTTLTQVPGGYNVDSFFDITYRIDFVGNPGGPFAGRSGSTTGTIRMVAGQPIPEPSTVALLAIGGLGAAGIAIRRRRAA